MGAGEVLPGRDPPARAEVRHDSEHTRVTRLFLAGRTVICKEPLGSDGQRRVRHELAMLARLRGVAGVAQLVEAPGFPGSVVRDVGGVCLAGLVNPWPVANWSGWRWGWRGRWRGCIGGV